MTAGKTGSKCPEVYMWRPWFPRGTYLSTLKQYFTTVNSEELTKDVEQKLERYLGSRHVVFMPSGTSAIFAVLEALLPRGDAEVLLPSLVCETVPYAVKAAGKRPVFLEINPRTFNIDESLIQAKVNAKTRAIIAVHQCGMPCNMARILQIAKQSNLLVIEDAAQALSAEYNGKKAGTIGDIGILSFNNKVIDACGGGAVVTDNDEYFNKIIQYRNSHFTLTRKGFFKHLIRSWLLSEHPKLAFALAQKLPVVEGSTIRRKLNLITPVLLESLLPLLDRIIERRRENFAWYHRYLTERQIQKPVQDGSIKSACTFYTIKLDHGNRDMVKSELERRHLYANILAKATHEEFEPESKLPVTTEVSQMMLSFPTDPHLNEEDIKFLSTVINGITKNLFHVG